MPAEGGEKRIAFPLLFFCPYEKIFSSKQEEKPAPVLKKP